MKKASPLQTLLKTSTSRRFVCLSQPRVASLAAAAPQPEPSTLMSPSVARNSTRRSVSLERGHGEPRRRGRSPVVSSPHSRIPFHKERSPIRHKSSHRDKGGSPMRGRHSGRVKSPKREKSSPPLSRSPSPRTKRLRRVQGERGAEKSSEREHERNDGKGSDKHERHHKGSDSYGRDLKEREFEGEIPKDKRDRKSERERERERDREKGKDRDGADGGSSRPRHRRSESPSDYHHHRSRHHSRSPPPASRSRACDEDEESRRAGHRSDDAADSLAIMEATEQALQTKEKKKPSFELSGKLAAETNRVRGNSQPLDLVSFFLESRLLVN